MWRAAALLLLAIATACERPRAYVICHNSNCVRSDPFLDDTVGALHESLALRWNGQPLIDGIEVDTVWDAVGSRCAFAHDPELATTSVSGIEAAEEVARHLVETASLVGDRRFYLKLDIKGYSGPSGGPLTAAEAIGQVDCALDMFETAAAAARTVDRKLTVLFNTDDPALVQLLVERPAYPGKRAGDAIQTGLILPLHVRPPSGLVPDVVSIAAKDVRPEQGAELAELRARGIDVMLWMLDADISVLDAIQEVEPRFVATNEAVVLREWLGPPPEM